MGEVLLSELCWLQTREKRHAQSGGGSTLMSQSQDEWCCSKTERPLFGAIKPDLTVSASPSPKKSAWGEQTQLQQQTGNFLPHCHFRLDPCESRRAPGQLQISLPQRFGWLPDARNEADHRRLTHALCLYESQLHRAEENTAPSQLSGEKTAESLCFWGGFLRNKAGTQRININTEYQHKWD